MDLAGMSERERAEALTQKFTDLSIELDPTHNANPLMLRMRRATSWITRAAEEEKDHDIAFVCYWVAFNSLYGDAEAWGKSEATERKSYRRFIGKIIGAKPLLYKDIAARFTEDELRSLIGNQYLLAPYWERHTDWRKKLQDDESDLETAMQRKNDKTVLNLCFNRLYALRSQLMHGSATWKSSMNRQEVDACRKFAAFLVPLLANCVLDCPDAADWGEPYNPPSNQTKLLGAQDRR